MLIFRKFKKKPDQNIHQNVSFFKVFVGGAYPRTPLPCTAYGFATCIHIIHFFCKNTTTFTVFVCFLDWLALHFNLVVFIFNNWMKFLGTM